MVADQCFDLVGCTRRASVLVTHAGMGGCSEGLYQGVPMVAVPQAVDQFSNAAMLEELGVGVQLPMKQATPEARPELPTLNLRCVPRDTDSCSVADRPSLCRV